MVSQRRNGGNPHLLGGRGPSLKKWYLNPEAEAATFTGVQVKKAGISELGCGDDSGK